MKAYKNKNQELDARIFALETKQKSDFLALKMEINAVYTQLRPSKLLQRVIADIRESPKAKKSLLETLLSITGGYFSKKLIVGKSTNMFKSLLGYAVQYVSTKIISKKI